MKNIIALIIVFGLLTSCNQITDKVNDKLNLLEVKTNQLDSLINTEIDKVMALDTLINFENEKVQQLDELINKSTTRIDSIANHKVNTLRNILK